MEKKIFANHTPDYGFIPKYIFLKFSKLNHKTAKNSIKNSKDMKSHFIKEDIAIGNRNLKRCSISLVIKEVQIKTSVRYNYTSISITKIK